MRGKYDQFALATSTLGEAVKAGAGSELKSTAKARTRFIFDLQSGGALFN
jgi:hypothetical protein